MYNKDGLTFFKGEGNHEFLVVDSSKIEQAHQYISCGEEAKLMLSEAHGFDFSDMQDLIHLKDHIYGLIIIAEQIDLNIINEFSNITLLSLPPKTKNKINLDLFRNLKSFGFTYGKNILNLDSLLNIKSLTITNLKPDIFEKPWVIDSVEDVELINPKINVIPKLSFLNNVSSLKIFGASNLQNLDALKNYNQLRYLELERMKKIENYDFLHQLNKLESLIISNSKEIENLKFLEKLSNLKHFVFWDTLVVDGDLSLCQDIDYVGFQNQRHYSHKISAFRK